MLADDENVILPQDRRLLRSVIGELGDPMRTRWKDAHDLGATQGGDTIARMCSSKRSWFWTREEADKAARDVSARYGEPFSSYPCRACWLFHLTTRPQ